MMRLFLSPYWISWIGFCFRHQKQFYDTEPSLLTVRLSRRDSHEEETAEQRQARMEQVRKIQAAFYRSSEKEDRNNKASWSTVDPKDPSLMHNLPLWRVQWTELPGFQNVLNVHVPHYTHMFRQLIYQQTNENWLFGHVYLPGGSENISNPLYALPTSKDQTERQDPQDESKTATIGTLMKITDYKEEDDGRITLLVQAIGRLQILQAAKQVPYAMADTARILVDWEAAKAESSLVNDSQENNLALQNRIKRAQAVTAVKEAQLLRDLEFRSVRIDNGSSNQLNQPQIPSVSPLSNVNGDVTLNWKDIQDQLDKLFVEQVREDDDYINVETLTYTRSSAVEEEVLELERKLWISLDRLLQLLEAAQPGMRIPVPTQLLGLLPRQEEDRAWPPNFRLEKYANQLQKSGTLVGTATRSPFVWLSRTFPDYPVLRRASRLSFAIWLLVESIAIGNTSFDRQAYIETHSLRMRLQKTLQHIEKINFALEQILR